jgi:hypothetical protein
MIYFHLLLALVSPIVAATEYNHVPPTGDYIRLELRTSGTSCYIEEPFWIDVLMINVTDDTIRIPYPTPEEELLHFEGRFHGQPIVYEGVSTLSLKTPMVRVSPGDTVHQAFNLWESFLRAETWNNIPKTGRVTLAARFGGVITNEISFTIETPIGSDAEAYKLWQAYKDSYWVYPFPTEQERFQYLREIIASYRSTGYAEWATYELVRKSAKNNEDPRKQEYAKSLITDYPSSGFVRNCLPVFLGMFDPSEKDSVLKSLMSTDKPLRMRLIVSNRIRGYKYH